MRQLKKMKYTLAQQHCRATALRVALFVGTVLFSLNHGSALMNDEMSQQRWISGILTYMVPFMVSIHGQSSRKTA
ncbi:MAG: nitrate/nitrite transporter NrtS [Cyanobacteria bacterium J06597_16]